MRRILKATGAAVVLSFAAVLLRGSTGCGTAGQDSATAQADASVRDASRPLEAATPLADGPAPPQPTWIVSLDSTAGSAISPAILGEYDLSGVLWHYDQVPGLLSAMQTLGLPEWRVSVERWEGRSEMFPTLTDGTTPCPDNDPTVFVPSGWTDRDLLVARDWFTDDGMPVTAAMTTDDSRYALAYARQVLDMARTFGAEPFVSIDNMPAAFARGTTPTRTDCFWTGFNEITNTPPTDPAVFASAVVGLVQRLVMGSSGEPGRPVRYFDFWNEPEGSFWDSSFDPDLSIFFSTAEQTLRALAALRTAIGHPELRFGFAGFVAPSTAITAIQRFDALNVPLDFISFHAYDSDPIGLAGAIDSVMAAVKASVHYQGIEVALTEWGPSAEIENNDPARQHPNLAYATSMQPALHEATVLARAATAGLQHAHHVYFWDFNKYRIRGLLQYDLATTPQYYAKVMAAEVIGNGAKLVTAAGTSDTQVVVASRDAGDQVHVLLVNLDTRPQVAQILVAGASVTPKRVRLYSDPAGAIVDGAAVGDTVAVPGQSIVRIDL